MHCNKPLILVCIPSSSLWCCRDDASRVNEVESDDVVYMIRRARSRRTRGGVAFMGRGRSSERRRKYVQCSFMLIGMELTETYYSRAGDFEERVDSHGGLPLEVQRRVRR